MKVLIIGGLGFIGHWTCQQLTSMDHKVVILDNLDRKVHGNTIWKSDAPNAEYHTIIGDIRDKDLLLESLKGIDVVYSFAAHQDYMSDYSNFIDVNVTGIALLYEVIRKHKLPIKQVILSSSQSVYGESKYYCPNSESRCDKIEYYVPPPRNILNQEWDFHCPVCSNILQPHPHLETDISNPVNIYGISKLYQEQLALKLGKWNDIPTTVLRYSIVQGAGQSFYNAYSGACRNFCVAYKSGKSPLVYEDGLQQRDYVNIHDVIDANLLVLNNPQTFNKIYNVSGNKSYTTLEFANLVKIISGSIIEPTITGLSRSGDVRHTISSNFKLKKLGWSPKRSIDESIKEYLNWLDPYLKTLDKSEDLYHHISRANEDMIRQEILK